MSGLIAMLDAIEKAKQRGLEAERRKNEYREICSNECTNIQCPYRREENYGKPCKMQFEQYKTPPKPLPKITRSTEEEIKSLVQKAFKPITNRIERLENKPDYHSPTYGYPNGKETRKRVDIGMNQERNCHD